MFNVATLNFITTMPPPHYLGVDIADELPQKYVFSYFFMSIVIDDNILSCFSCMTSVKPFMSSCGLLLFSS